MTRITTVLTTIFATPEDARSALRLTEKQYAHITAPDPDVRIQLWLLRILMDDYRINPLYIFGLQARMYIPEKK
jgi:hypothetical protein